MNKPDEIRVLTGEEIKNQIIYAKNKFLEQQHFISKEDFIRALEGLIVLCEDKNIALSAGIKIDVILHDSKITLGQITKKP